MKGQQTNTNHKESHKIQGIAPATLIPVAFLPPEKNTSQHPEAKLSQL